jgi:hypothetical protein
MNCTRWLLAGLSIVVLTAASAAARPPADGQDPASSGFGTNVIDLATTFDINEMVMFVSNQGSIAYDQLAGDSGLEWPKDSAKHVIFASGLWLGATVNGTTQVTVGEYSQEYAAGPLMNDGSGDPVDPDEADPQWRVLKLEPSDIGDTSNEDYVLWKQLAVDLGEDGPPVDESGEPDFPGDQALWCVYNDGVASKHTNDAGFSDPLGIEVRQLVFGFSREGALGKTVFVDFEFENKGPNVLEDMYVSLWSDPDLGGATDDLVGCDTTLSLGYCYNATNQDNDYTSHPPAVGYDFFLGPVVAGDTLGMASFNKYINGTDPNSKEQTYNYMQGLNADGTPQTCLGEETTFVLSGDPVEGTGCLDADPADRRFMLSTGPITLNPGDEQRIVAAIVIGGESGKGDRLSNISLLKFYDSIAQDAFDRDFQVPNAPPQPSVLVTEMDNEVILSWGSESQNEYDELGYEFEGYNIYQGSSVSGPWTKIATYDVANGIAQIADAVFNPDVGGLEVVVVQNGTDSGVQQEIVLTDDVIRGGPLRNARSYYYAVTAYSYGADAVAGQRTLENPRQAVTVVPQSQVSGVDTGAAAVSEITYTHDNAGAPAGDSPTTTGFEVEIIQPTLVTGHDYRINFVEEEAPFDVSIDGETHTVTHTWHVTDTTTDQVVLDDQFNLTGNNQFDIFDGIRLTATGVYFPQVQDAIYENINTENRRGLSWVDWGGRWFGGAWDTGCHWAGSQIQPEEEGCGTEVIPDRFGTVELRFDGEQGGYRYDRRDVPNEEGGAGGSPDNGRGYIYSGFVPIGCTAWKVVGDTETQLTIMYCERLACAQNGDSLATQPESRDGRWFPTSEGDGGREYITILDLEYNEDPATYPNLQQDGIYFSGDDPTIGFPALYGGWLRIRGDTGVIDPEDKFTTIWGNPADEYDVWDFSTTSATGVTSGVVDPDFGLAKTRGDLERIRVVPNPYLTRSAYELDQFNRIVKFINLPATCTVRVFTLAGDLVRRLDKDDANTSVLEWDLENEFQLPVGSGIYVYHVEAPGIGNHFGKMIVFNEKERLQEF